VLLKILWMLELLAKVRETGYAPRELARQTDFTRSEWNETMDALRQLELVSETQGVLVLGDSVTSLPLSELYLRFPVGLSLESLPAYQGCAEVVAPLKRFLMQGEETLGDTVAECLEART